MYHLNRRSQLERVGKDGCQAVQPSHIRTVHRCSLAVLYQVIHTRKDILATPAPLLVIHLLCVVIATKKGESGDMMSYHLE